MRTTERTVITGFVMAMLVSGIGWVVSAGGRAGSITHGPNGEEIFTPDQSDRVRSEYDYIDLGLTPAQEESLALELHGRGVLGLDMERTPEEENAFKYLTRPICLYVTRRHPGVSPGTS